MEPTNKPEASTEGHGCPSVKPLTWEQALEKVAEIHIGDDEPAVAYRFAKTEVKKFYAEAADLYARSKWEQACKDQMKAFFDGLKNKVLPELKPGTLTYYAIEELIKRQEEHPFPAPEFKP